MEDNLSKFCIACGIEDPRMIDLCVVDLDSKIRNFVLECNKSGWLFTLNSCQGHFHSHDNSFSSPYFTFIVDNLYETEIIKMAYEVCRGCFVLDSSSIVYGGYDVMFSKNYRSEFYSVISVYWGKDCIENDKFYSNLFLLLEGV